MTSPSEEFVIRKRKISLDNAAELDAEGISFTHLRVSDTSDETANVQIIFANLDNPGITLQRGIRLENFAIRSAKVWFTNTAQPGKFVEIEYWGGPPVGPPRIVNEGLIIDVALSQGSTLDDPATVTVGVAVVQLVAANSSRKAVRFHNDGPATVYLGNSNVAVADGIPLEPSATWIEGDLAAATWSAIAAAAGNTVRVQTGS